MAFPELPSISQDGSSMLHVSISCKGEPNVATFVNADGHFRFRSESKTAALPEGFSVTLNHALVARYSQRGELVDTFMRPAHFLFTQEADFFRANPDVLSNMKTYWPDDMAVQVDFKTPAIRFSRYADGILDPLAQAPLRQCSSEEPDRQWIGRMDLVPVTVGVVLRPQTVTMVTDSFVLPNGFTGQTIAREVPRSRFMHDISHITIQQMLPRIFPMGIRPAPNR